MPGLPLKFVKAVRNFSSEILALEISDDWHKSPQKYALPYQTLMANLAMCNSLSQVTVIKTGFHKIRVATGTPQGGNF